FSLAGSGEGPKNGSHLSVLGLGLYYQIFVVDMSAPLRDRICPVDRAFVGDASKNKKGIAGMDISRDVHTELLIRHGDLQTSPQHAAMLNAKAEELFISN